MTENNKAEPTVEARPTLGQQARQAGLFVLFGTILFIPRIRRLRRRPGAWACVRLAVAGCATWLVWRHTQGNSGVASMVAGLLLFAFALLVRAKPLAKSVDEIARELGALIVLNGGTFRASSRDRQIRGAKIVVHPARVIVLGPDERELLEIPLGAFQNMAARPHVNRESKKFPAWQVDIDWLSDAPQTTTFAYEGPFAEHLAQVAESTLRSQWKKELPVVPQ